ncbi:TPA: Ig domain-containing protein [Clostridium perfringens]
MALTYLPKLPDGLHPFYCIFQTYNGDLYIVSGDYELKLQYYYAWGFPNFSTYQKLDENTKCWVKGEEHPYQSSWAKGPYDENYIIYVNYDLYTIASGGYNAKLFKKKSPEATEININGGDIRNMQKGMIWNVGAAVSINPPEAPQICTFSSSNPDVCTVDETGKIVAVGEGECVITIMSKM